MAGRKSQAVKAAEHRTVRANLRLDAAQYQRLLVFSVMESMNAGDIVSRLIEQHLRGWSMPGKIAAPGTRKESAKIEHEINLDQLAESIAA